MDWDPELYLRFREQRFEPLDDLAALLAAAFPEPSAPLRILDLGCGNGEPTARLALRFPDARVVGVDSSPAMIAAAAPFAGPRVEFRVGRIEDAGGEWDGIFSNAALQWLDDHPALVARLFGMLAPGGRLAVQVPSNHDHPSQTELRATAEEEPFARELGGWEREISVLPIDRYARILHDLGARDIAAIEKIYPHVLPDAAAVAEWIRGTSARPYLERLPESLREPFMDRYRERLRAREPGAPTFFGFRRTLFAGTRP